VTEFDEPDFEVPMTDSGNESRETTLFSQYPILDTVMEDTQIVLYPVDSTTVENNKSADGYSNCVGNDIINTPTDSDYFFRGILTVIRFADFLRTFGFVSNFSCCIVSLSNELIICAECHEEGTRCNSLDKFGVNHPKYRLLR